MQTRRTSASTVPRRRFHTLDSAQLCTDVTQQSSQTSILLKNFAQDWPFQTSLVILPRRWVSGGSASSPFSRSASYSAYTPRMSLLSAKHLQISKPFKTQKRRTPRTTLCFEMIPNKAPQTPECPYTCCRSRPKLRRGKPARRARTASSTSRTACLAVFALAWPRHAVHTLPGPGLHL